MGLQLSFGFRTATARAEGNPSLQTAVSRAGFLEPRHLAVAVPVSALVGAATWWIAAVARPLLLGFVWGPFFIVSATHVGNLIGYVGSRRGIHGRVWMHQRTGYVVQAGRYVGVTALLAALALCSGSVFIVGTAVAGIASTARVPVDSEVPCDGPKRRCA
jgi:hypothetical protein